ncbi:MAG TPA: hemerythrin family protein [Gammaproteobacteria bacterium]|nr:hemerythrin family protein [Gammaproteobacteria bacterium]
MKQRGIGQKIAYISAIIFYVCGIGCVIAAFYYNRQLGSDNPIVASLMASVVFFIGSGIVLHVIGKVDLPDLKIQSDKS